MVLNKSGKSIIQVASCSPSLQAWLAANIDAEVTKVKGKCIRKGVSQARELRRATSTKGKGKSKSSKGDEGKHKDKGAQPT